MKKESSVSADSFDSLLEDFSVSTKIFAFFQIVLSLRCEKGKYMDKYLQKISVHIYLYLRSDGIIKEWKKYSEKEQ